MTTALGRGEPNGPSHNPRISGDGRWIVYESEASNLVGGDTNQTTDIFLFDRQLGGTTRVSVGSSGEQADLPSLAPAISNDGSVIAFVSASTLLSAETDNLICERGPPACRRACVVDRAAVTTRRVLAPPIATSRVVTVLGVPTTVTYRIEASLVFVSPDGASVAVNAVCVPSVLTTPTIYGTENWVYDRSPASSTTGRGRTSAAGTAAGSPTAGCWAAGHASLGTPLP